MSKAATDPTTPPKSWRDVIKVHPAADLFPIMPPDELKTLGEDIEKKGLCVLVTLWQAEAGAPVYLLDGRNRLDAAEAAGVSVLNRQGSQLDCRISNCACGGDPYELVLTFNMHRRHLTPEQKRELIAKVLKAQPDKSNRQIARQTKADDKTVAAVRGKLETTAEIPQLTKTIGADGKARTTFPTRKARSTADDFIANRKAQAMAVADRAEKQVQTSAQSVSIPKQSDTEHVLPDADRLVLEILERDQIAPGYAKAVITGIAARLEVSGYPDMPDVLRREPTIAPNTRT